MLMLKISGIIIMCKTRHYRSTNQTKNTEAVKMRICWAWGVRDGLGIINLFSPFLLTMCFPLLFCLKRLKHVRRKMSCSTLHARLLVANCADERGQTDRQKDIQTDRQTDRQRDIQTDRQTDWHTDSTLSLDRTGLFHHCWASPAAVGQILSKIILSYPPGLFTERGAPHFWKDTKLSFFKAILLMVMLHKVA